MTTLDIFVLAGLATGMILGFRDGLFRKLFGILGFWGSLILATRFMGVLGDQFVLWFDFSSDIAYVLAFSFIFSVTMVIVTLIYRSFGPTTSESLSIPSRFAGGFLGVVQGAMAMSLLLLMFNVYEVPSEETRKESIFHRPLIKLVPAVFDYSTTWLPETKAFVDEIQTKISTFRIAH